MGSGELPEKAAKIDKSLFDRFLEHSSFEEFALYESLNGREVTDAEISHIVAAAIGVYSLYANQLESTKSSELLSISKHLNHIVIEKDLITAETCYPVIENICNVMASNALDSAKAKAGLMACFKHLTAKFPKEMAKCYNRHKIFYKFEA